ncbi:MAG: DNA-protecting protein DprA [Parachlamydiaceae bacterium]|nr:DNA-protecting protein DprA [Parachlamydiaceae bacterium]
MADLTELEALAILSATSGMGAIKIRFLLQSFGEARLALQASSKEIGTLRGFERIAPHWNSWQTNLAWQKDLELADKYGVTLIPYTSPHYPKRLLEIPDHPILLYVQGSIKPQDQRCIAIVGTRNASIYGNEMAEAIAKDLAGAGFTIVSGLARGVDTAAHCGALERGRTLAVIGSGLANIYPRENIALAGNIARQGALISEFPMSTSPERQNFPQRNRIVSGMTMATLLIEAPVKSGAMITMDRALTQKRKLFALPGRADNENFRGNHLLIKNGQAQLIENAQDILSHFNDFFGHVMLPLVNEVRCAINAEEEALLKLMPTEEVNIEQLVHLSCFPVQHVQRTLMSLVLKKLIKEFPGKIYKKK